MFRCNARPALVICVLAGAAALAPGTAYAQQPSKVQCLISNPTKAPPGCTVTVTPNLVIFCGQEVTPFPSHRFVGCRVRAGQVSAECGDGTDFTPIASYKQVTGCILTVGGQKIVIGCQRNWFQSGSGFSSDKLFCGVAPVAGCTYQADSGAFGRITRAECGREPLVIRCYRAEFSFPYQNDTYRYCEFVVGPSVSPIARCRIDLISPEATLASANECLAGILET